MLQGKTKRKQEKVIYRFKILSLFLSTIFLILILSLIYTSFIKKAILVNPLSENKLQESTIYSDLTKHAISFTTILEKTDYFIVTLSDNSMVYITKNKSIGQQLSSLQLIRSKLKIEGKEIKSLDLRFDQPVIKLK